VRNQEEFKVVADNVFVDHRSWFWVELSLEEESVVDSLVHKDLSVLWIVDSTILGEGSEGLGDGWEFHVEDQLGLGLSYTISVEDDHFWETSVDGLILFQGISHEVTHDVDELLAFFILDVSLGVELGEIGVNRGTEANDTLLVVSGVMEDISTDKHGVLWDAGWSLSFPKDLSSLTEDLKGNVVHDGHVHLWSLIIVPSGSSTSASVFSFTSLLDEDGVHLDNGVDDSNVWKGLLLDVGVELAALVIDEEHDELEVRVHLHEFSDLQLDLLLEVLWVNPLPEWLSDGNTEVLGGLGELVDKLIDSVVRLLITVTEGCVDTGPVVKLDTFLIDGFDLEEAIFDESLLSFSSDDLWWLKTDGFNFWGLGWE
jgi:hypothetical protein